MVENRWTYQGKIFDSSDAKKLIDEGILGFVYEITDNETKKKYIGKKLLQSKRRLAPLKGKKRKRIRIVESDWEDYYGSSETLKTLVEERKASFSREILYFAAGKGELSYMEAKLQFDKEVLLTDDYYNGIISCRINHKHVGRLKKK